MTTTPRPGPPPPVDAGHDPHLSGVFEPVIHDGQHGAWLPTEE
ncbi:hypothetical protein [Actinomycetospora cinnamomea]|uniref:Uncharacterized protein n=1 Tax=Actinomycetospora cinnamomea TaxID=663609 RepID=A0A2U1FS87_9PSEU|nr:hypothetical protein [Actinomycetospora cinnamomea]PVZ15061.1 hypothetical protein C8D89_101931 [Actinomycetospora cinnamomea]